MKNITPLTTEQVKEELILLIQKLDLTTLHGFDYANDHSWYGNVGFDTMLKDGSYLFAENVNCSFYVDSKTGNITSIEIYGVEVCEQYDIDTMDSIKSFEI